MTAGKREALEALALRCEQATGVDREIDGSIWASTVDGYIEGRSIWYNDNGWVKHAVSLGDGIVRERMRLGDVDAAPAYTASLDAAMTLVPEGWRIRGLDASIRNRFSWHLEGPMEYERDEPTGPALAGGVAATPALALCAAALRVQEDAR